MTYSTESRRNLILSQQTKHWFTKVTANCPFFFAILDDQHRYILVNQRYSDVVQTPISELIGMNDTQVMGENFYQKVEPLYQRAFQGEAIEESITLDPRLGTSLHLSVSPIESEGKICSIAVQAMDTSENYSLYLSLQESEQRLSILSSLISEGVILVANECILSVNEQARSILGFDSPHQLLGESLSRFFSGYQGDETNFSTQLNLEPKYCYTSSFCGVKRKVELTGQATTILGSPSKVVILKSVNHTEQISAQTKHEDLHIDSLTKLDNRFVFTKKLEQHLKSLTPLVLLYLDIDNFKNINDSLGHHIGDKVLREVALRLKRLLPNETTIGHLGGDEFGVILPNPESKQVADLLSERIISVINQPFDLHHFSKRLACSIGSVESPNDGKDARVLLQNADTAMYEAKDRGRNRLIKFNDQMNKEARMRLWLEIELQKALQQNGLEVWYQPKVNAQSFSICGAEALVRWKHPVEGYISPSSFIPVAEKAGLIEQLGRVVMRDVFATVKQWKSQGILPGRVAINISPEQFGNRKLIDYLEKLLRTTGLDPSSITFELTESAVMSDSEHTLQMLNAIKRLGFWLSIDDFGTGYSSLAYLARFPIDELKIDRAFISGIGTLPKQITVIENIINLGRSLELTVVAEGVENQKQAALLSNLRCHAIQGFHFYRPQPKHEVEELFAENYRHNIIKKSKLK